METSQHVIEVGAQVRLKSGGPKMMVNFINVFGLCECVWFDGTENRKAMYARAALVLVEGE